MSPPAPETSPGDDESAPKAAGKTKLDPGGPADGEKAEDTAGTPPDQPRRRMGWLTETAVVLVIAVVVAVLLRTFVIQTFEIPSGSMEPTLEIGDRILVDKLSYHLHSVHRGDIIVFKTPPAENCGGIPVAHLVKRVIGLPGEYISSHGNTVYINGKPLKEPWLPKGIPLGQAIPDPIPGLSGDRIPANSYFVMGDNRDDSCDSRDWGVVNRSLIVGRVVAIFWPFSQFHFF